MTANRKGSKRLNSVQAIHAPWKWGHTLTLPAVALLAYLDATAPGILADLNALTLTSNWQVTLGLRVGLLVLCFVAFFLIRSYHWTTGTALFAMMVGQAFRLGSTQALEEPLTLGTLVLIIAMVMIPIRVIVRPNEADLRAHINAQERET